MPPAVAIRPSPAMTSVPGPMTMSTPGCVSGLPALPMRRCVRPDADVGLDDTPVVDDEGVGDDRVDAPGAAGLALAHAIANALAAAETDLLAEDGVVALDLDPQGGIARRTRSPVVGP